MKTRTLYMHTLDGKPAEYASSPEPHIGSPASRFGYALAFSLEQIRDEQGNVIRAALDRSEVNPSARYGYVRVRVPV